VSILSDTQQSLVRIITERSGRVLRPLVFEMSTLRPWLRVLVKDLPQAVSMLPTFRSHNSSQMLYTSTCDGVVQDLVKS
jgi:hypothetical protein